MHKFKIEYLILLVICAVLLLLRAFTLPERLENTLFVICVAVFFGGFIGTVLFHKAFIRRYKKAAEEEQATLEERNALRKAAGIPGGDTAPVFDDSPETGKTLEAKADVLDKQIGKAIMSGTIRYNQKMLQILPDNIVISYQDVLKVELYSEGSIYILQTKSGAGYNIRFANTYAKDGMGGARDFEEKISAVVGKIEKIIQNQS